MASQNTAHNVYQKGYLTGFADGYEAAKCKINNNKKYIPTGTHKGRPYGAVNKYYKLDKHKKDIHKWMKLDLSIISMSRLLHCHCQTIVAWISRNPIKNKDAN